MSQVKVNFADLELSLKTLTADATRFLESTAPLEALLKQLTNAQARGPNQTFNLEILRANPVKTNQSSRTFTVRIGDEQLAGQRVIAEVSFVWDCKTLPPAGKPNGRPVEFEIVGRASSKCVLFINTHLGGRHNLVEFHGDIQSVTGPKPSLHFQLVDANNDARLDFPRLIAAQVSIIDFIDLVLGEVFAEWPIAGSTPRETWEGQQKRRLEQIFELYRKASRTGGFNGLRELCAHGSGVIL